MEGCERLPKVALTTLGCKVNQVETEIMEGLFLQRGYEVVDFNESADFYIINTCSVTHLGERKSRQLIRRAHRENKDAVIAVTGCYAQIASKEIAAIEGVRVVIGTQERAKIVDLVEQAASEDKLFNEVNDIMKTRDFEDIPLYGTPHRTRAFLKIQDGCCNFCTFCIIPYARGPVRSRSLSSIKSAVDKLVEENFHEVVLTGIHIGAYGRDFKGENISLGDAVDVCLANPNLKRVRLGSLESVEISAHLMDLIKHEKRFTKHLHLPLQAGSNAILKAMNRHYTSAEFAKLIENIRNEIPDIAISTDIIVGFPGETDELFEESLNFAKSIGFAKMHVFPYSKRAGTPAAKMPNQVDEAVKKQRVHRMQEMAEESAKAFHEKFIGKTLEVLFEQEKDGYTEGLTSNYIKVYVNEKIPSGELHNVELCEIYQDGILGKIKD